MKIKFTQLLTGARIQVCDSPYDVYNFFQEGYFGDVGCKGMFDALFVDACVLTAKAYDEAHYNSCLDSINPTNWDAIWRLHRNDSTTRVDYPYYVASLKKHSLISGIAGENLLGYQYQVPEDRECPPGDPQDFAIDGDLDTDADNIILLFYEPTKRLEDSLIQYAQSIIYAAYADGDSAKEATYRELKDYAPRLWGHVMTHEMAHYYACLTHYGDNNHTANYPCPMRPPNYSDYDYWLHFYRGIKANADYGLLFCPKCKGHIGNATEEIANAGHYGN